MSTKEYRDTIAYLYEQLPMYQREGTKAFKKDLTNTRALCAALDHPQQKFQSVHIAGTNGKGSVSHMIAAPLQEMGLSVGLYTSPHYRDFRERIKINGDYISRESVVAFVRRHQCEFEEIQPSFFEITVAMAFWHFAREKVDIAIIETGLGGRLDSTNILNPMLSVITNIGFDHMDMLGETLPEIAREKAGIIKEHTPVIIGEKQPEVENVFSGIAERRGATLWFAEDLCEVEGVGCSETHQHIRIACNDCFSASRVRLEALGSYQVLNARTALAALCELRINHFTDTFDVTHVAAGWEHLRKGTCFIGRFQLLSRHPDILVDSAHNAEGLKTVLGDIRERSFRRLHIVLGLVREKNPKEIVALFPRDARYYFARANIPRGMEVEVLQNAASSLERQGSAYSSIAEALEAAKEAAKENDLIFVGGSTFTVAEVL